MISCEEVLKLAELARLRIADVEVKHLQKDISDILEYVGQVSACAGNSSTTVEELPAHAHRNVMREDIPRVPEDLLIGKEEVLKVAFPVRDGDYNVVRKIIQKDD